MTETITVSNSAVDSAADKQIVCCENQGDIDTKFDTQYNNFCI